MNPLRLAAIAAASLALPAVAAAQSVVINEFQYDDSSLDDREFVELYNAGTTPVDISGWTLAANDENTPNASYVVAANTVLAPGAFWVLGAATVANVDQVVGVSDLWQNSMETLELLDTANNLVDAVVYEVNKLSFTLSPALVAQTGPDGLWGNLQSNDVNPQSWSRYRDGLDTNNNGRDFRMAPATPGASNDLPPLVTLIDSFEGYPLDSDIPGWDFSFVPARAVNPLQLGTNPNSIPQSPGGGQALLFWDPAGGGNAGAYLGDPLRNMVLECYAYFDATPEPTGEFETWAIGLQGTCPTFYNSPDPAGTFGFTANGATGVGLVYQNTDQGGTLYLVDHNDGGWGAGAGTPARVLGSVAIQSGVNDGWQRIRIEAGEGFAQAFFGGTYGARDGQRLAGAIAPGGIGGIWIGYREFLTNNGSARPLTIDDLLIRPGQADASLSGIATPNTVATPAITANSLPTLGNAAFATRLSGLSTNGGTLLVIGFSTLNPPLNLELFGAQPGSRVYPTVDISLALVPSAAGEASLSFGIPNNTAFAGGRVYLQGIDIDTALGGFLPVAQTPMLTLTLGS